MGSFIDLESSFTLKSFINSLGCSNINYEFNLKSFFDFRFFYLMSNSLLILESLSYCLLISLDLRIELPLLHTRLRKSFLKSESSHIFFSLGLSLDYLSFPVVNLGNSLKTLLHIVEGRFFFLTSFLLNNFISLKLVNYCFCYFSNLSFLLGSSALNRLDSSFFFDSIYFIFSKISLNLNYVGFFFNVISNFLGRISSFEVGALNTKLTTSNLINNTCTNSVLYLLGVDSLNFNFKESFVIFQGSFQNALKSLKQTFLIFPVSIFVENVFTFINLEGLVRKTKKAITINSSLFNDHELLKALFFYKDFFFKSNFSVLTHFYKTAFLFVDTINYMCFFFSSFLQNMFHNFFSSISVTVVFFINFLFLNFSKTKLINS